jgi:hypothetical protein
MEITRAPKGILQMDDVVLCYKNFSGEGSKFNREGDRNFSIRIYDEAIAEELSKDGWNVKVKPPRDDDEAPFMHLPVKIKFNDRGPNVYLQSGPNRIRLDEESVACLDDVDILSGSLDIRPYDWEVNGKTGRTAYLHSMLVTQQVDRFAMDE